MGESRRKQQEVVEIGDAKKVLLEIELRARGERQKEASGNYRSRAREEGPARKRAAGRGEVEGSSKKL